MFSESLKGVVTQKFPGGFAPRPPQMHRSLKYLDPPLDPLQSPQCANRRNQPRRHRASLQKNNEVTNMDSSEDSSSEDELFVVQSINPSDQLSSNNSQSNDTNNVESQSETTLAPLPPQPPPAENEQKFKFTNPENFPWKMNV